jgi:hypothetical protein
MQWTQQRRYPNGANSAIAVHPDGSTPGEIAGGEQLQMNVMPGLTIGLPIVCAPDQAEGFETEILVTIGRTHVTPDR